MVIRASEPTRGTLQVFQKADNYRAPAAGNEQPVPIELAARHQRLHAQAAHHRAELLHVLGGVHPREGQRRPPGDQQHRRGVHPRAGQGPGPLDRGDARRARRAGQGAAREGDRGQGAGRAQDRRLGGRRRRPAADRPGPASALRLGDPGQRPQGGVHREPAPASGLQLPRHGGRPGHARRPRQLRRRRLDEHAGRKGAAGRHADQGDQGPGHRRHGPDHARQRDPRGELLAEGRRQGRDQGAVELRLRRPAPLGGPGSVAVHPAADRLGAEQHAPRHRPDDARRHARLRPVAPDGHEGA